MFSHATKKEKGREMEVEVLPRKLKAVRHHLQYTWRWADHVEHTGTRGAK